MTKDAFNETITVHDSEKLNKVSDEGETTKRLKELN